MALENSSFLLLCTACISASGCPGPSCRLARNILIQDCCLLTSFVYVTHTVYLTSSTSDPVLFTLNFCRTPHCLAEKNPLSLINSPATFHVMSPSTFIDSFYKTVLDFCPVTGTVSWGAGTVKLTSVCDVPLTPSR